MIVWCLVSRYISKTMLYGFRLKCTFVGVFYGSSKRSTGFELHLIKFALFPRWLLKVFGVLFVGYCWAVLLGLFGDCYLGFQREMTGLLVVGILRSCWCFFLDCCNVLIV